jgi:hypothetical protein
MRRHARTILAPAFVTLLALGVLAGAEPAAPKADSLTVEGLADGKLVIRHTASDGKSVDLKIERKGDGRFRLGWGGGRPIACDRFRIAEDGRMDLFGNVEMAEQKGVSFKADELRVVPPQQGTRPIELPAPTKSKTPNAKP